MVDDPSGGTADEDPGGGSITSADADSALIVSNTSDTSSSPLPSSLRLDRLRLVTRVRLSKIGVWSSDDEDVEYKGHFCSGAHLPPGGVRVGSWVWSVGLWEVVLGVRAVRLRLTSLRFGVLIFLLISFKGLVRVGLGWVFGWILGGIARAVPTERVLSRTPIIRTERALRGPAGKERFCSFYGSAWFGSVWGGFLGGIARAGFPTENTLRTLNYSTVDQNKITCIWHLSIWRSWRLNRLPVGGLEFAENLVTVFYIARS